MKREIKKCIKYYLENINSDEYKANKIKDDIEGRKVHREYIEEEKPLWKERIDYYDNSIITKISLYDILSNDGVARLLHKIYGLPKKKFDVKKYYKKPSLINKYDYIQLQYTHSKYGIFAEINLLEDKYIKSIEISWTQINSYFAFLEYEFRFKVCLDDELYHQFIYDNMRFLNSKDYITWYHVNKDKNMNNLMLQQMTDEFFALICQHYITSFLYSEQGKTNPLINMVYMTRKEPINIDTLYLGDFGVSYYNQKSNFVILSDFDGVNHCLYTGDNSIPHFNICAYIAKYGNEFYNRFFGNRDLKIFEKDFSKFSTGRKKITYNKELNKLLNKMQGISEVENKKFEDFYKEFNSRWSFYLSNDKMDLEIYHKKSVVKFEDIYKNNFLYLKLLCEMNYSKSNYINSIIVTLVSIIAMIISLIALLYK